MVVAYKSQSLTNLHGKKRPAEPVPELTYFDQLGFWAGEDRC